MPFFSPGSSEQFLVPPAVTAQATAAVRDKLAALSIDEPLPETYVGDRIRLLVQSPYRLFLYWSHARDPFATLSKAFGAGATRYELAVRLIDEESGEEHLSEASPTHTQWFDARPGHLYRAEIGLFAQGRPFIRLLTSANARTPRASVSHAIDEAPPFRVSATEFARVLNEAGYASDALEVTLEAADEATHDEATREIVRRLTGTEAPNDGMLAEMRTLFAALAFGASLQQLRNLVSPPLARWIEQIVAEQQEALDGARLLDLLREGLAFEMNYDETWSAAEIEALHRAARFVVGGSDVQLPARQPHIWMPSMTPGVVSRLARWRKIQ